MADIHQTVNEPLVDTIGDTTGGRGTLELLFKAGLFDAFLFVRRFF